jgi:hypothetical protein
MKNEPPFHAAHPNEAAFSGNPHFHMPEEYLLLTGYEIHAAPLAHG